jgi:hypothetical protein
MESQWYYSKAGQQFGPITAEQLKRMATTRELAPTDLVWKDGMANWVAASTVQGLFVQGTAATPLPVARPASPANPQRPAQPQQLVYQRPSAPQPAPDDPLGYLDQISAPTPTGPAAQPGYGQPYDPAGYDPYGQPEPAPGYPPQGYGGRQPAGKSYYNTAMSSLSVSIFGLCFFCIWFVSIPLAITGIVLAIKAMGKMAESGNERGKGLALAGLIVSIVACVFAALVVVVNSAENVGR